MQRPHNRTVEKMQPFRLHLVSLGVEFGSVLRTCFPGDDCHEEANPIDGSGNLGRWNDRLPFPNAWAAGCPMSF